MNPGSKTFTEWLECARCNQLTFEARFKDFIGFCRFLDNLNNLQYLYYIINE